MAIKANFKDSVGRLCCLINELQSLYNQQPYFKYLENYFTIFMRIIIELFYKFFFF